MYCDCNFAVNPISWHNKLISYTTETKRLAGKKIAVQDGWIIENGPFKGQNCFYIPNSTVGWIPQCDLINSLTLKKLIKAENLNFNNK